MAANGPLRDSGKAAGALGLWRLRPSNESVVAGPVRERRSVAIIDRIQPKPVAPNSNHHAVIVIVMTPHGVALSEGPEIVRVVIHSGDLHYLVRLGLVPGSAFDQNAGPSLGKSFSGGSLSGAPHLPQPMRGETVCADGAAEEVAHGLCDHEVDEEPSQFGQYW
jgi:hypothetical protein